MIRSSTYIWMTCLILFCHINTAYDDSDRPGGFGKVDIYFSFPTEGGWSKPINLGNTINTQGVDVADKVTPDKKYFLFDRPLNGEQAIYWISAEIIEREIKYKNIG